MRYLMSAVISLICLVAVPLRLAAQTPLGTDFTYQGQLKASGMPAITTADFKYSLFNDAAAGAQVGATMSKDNVGVVNGLFTLPLDFGPSAFNGDARWIEVAVRSPAGSGTFTTLSPRQPVSGTPYALQTRGLIVDSTGQIGVGTTAPSARLDVKGNGDTSPATGTPIARFVRGNANNFLAIFADSGGNYIVADDPGGNQKDLRLQTRNNRNIALEPNGTGKVGIGTSAPERLLHARGAIPALVLQDTASPGNQSGYVTFWNNSGVETGWMGYGTAGSPHFSVVNVRPGGNIVLAPGAGGVVSVPVLEITGADVAEKFPASEKLEPGMVVAIDPKNPGKLCLARGAYNRCVAGVVSGANNFPVGAVLGSMPENKDAPAIALSGRVYVQCDSTSNAIQPGDLLTTSDVAGHAMKVTDYPRGQGAIIGKAMTELKRGESGMVLVLVSLQ